MIFAKLEFSLWYLVDCKWSPWTNWDLCTRSCGGGMQGRTRSVKVPERNGGKRCEGDPMQMRNCNMQPCQSKQTISQKVIDKTRHSNISRVFF